MGVSAQKFQQVKGNETLSNQKPDDTTYVEEIGGEQIAVDQMEEQFTKDFGDILNDDDFFTNSQIEDSKVPPLPDDVSRKNEDVPPRTVRKAQPDQQTVKQEPKIDLSAYVAKSEHEELTKKYNDLQGKFNDLQGKMNNVGDISQLPLDELKVLRKIKYDVETTPLGLIVEDFYRGKLDTSKFVPAKKTAQEYMPENEAFNVEDAFNNPSSPSYRARVQLDVDQNELRNKYNEVGNYIKQVAAQPQPAETSKQWEEEEKKLLDELVTKVPTASKHRDSFIKWLQSQNNIYLLAWVAYTQAVNNAVKKKKGITEPSVTAYSRRGTAITEDYDKSDEEIEKEFGPEIGGL